MIPILYDKDETAFNTNGLGRLRDCISAVVTEERNGIYELDFEYPVSGANYELIQLGRIVGVVTDDTGDFQPFDIVSFEKPIDGVVTFHCVHISYRQSYMTVTGTGINSLSDAFTLLGTAEPSNPFTYWTDKDSTGYVAAADGIPKSVKQMLGGVEGSILDSYGGEYEWDGFIVKLWSTRGKARDFSIRYGVNMLTYDDETDAQGAYSSCVPFWTDGETTVVGNRVDSSGATITGRGECVPLDLSEKFEDAPTTAQLESMALSMMNGNNTFLPTQTIKVSFVRLQDLGMEDFSNLLQCGLCDTINVIFPDYGTTGQFKIVKTVWDVLMDRYEEMELGTLSTTLAEALGIDNGDRGGGNGATAVVVEQGTSGIWTYRKWSDGTAECWGKQSRPTATFMAWTNNMWFSYVGSTPFPTGLFVDTPVVNHFITTPTANIMIGGTQTANYGTAVSSTDAGGCTLYSMDGTNYGGKSYTVIHHVMAFGRWK